MIENPNKKTKQPWSTKKAMEQVYEMKLWGSNNTNFYSGEGSHHPDFVNAYLSVLQPFLASFENPITVCDLGCGDFNIGKELVSFSEKYIAIDIVKDLIDYNAKKFTADNLEFQCLDIATDDLPFGDCAIIRQVLQHISNAEVQNVLHKLTTFKYIILTEHLPEGDFIPNKDMISGQGIRLKKQSGLDILAAPFHFKVEDQKQLLSYKLPNYKGVVVTTLFKVF